MATRHQKEVTKLEAQLNETEGQAEKLKVELRGGKQPEVKSDDKSVQ